jgi:hypothetical protein
MKPTKEEILYNHVGADGMDDGTLKAMDEWAEIYHKEKLRDEFKAFNSFVLKLEAEGKIWLVDSYIEDFIKTKQ